MHENERPATRQLQPVIIMRTVRHTRSTLHLPLQLITAAVGHRAAAWSIHVRITPMTARNVRAVSALFAGIAILSASKFGDIAKERT